MNDKVKVHWNNNREEWIMRSMSNCFMQRFEDCANFKRRFPEADKDVVNIFKMGKNKKVGEYPLSDDDLDFRRMGI